ncbi:MAG: (2Fe-2S)-binding protein [Arenicella sp.]
MFESIESAEASESISFTFDNNQLSAESGMTVASALLKAGFLSFRLTPVSQSPRGPFCMMGACYDCLIKVDGVTVQACLTLVEEGMVVTRVPVMGKGDNIET